MGEPECYLYETVIIKSYLNFYSANIKRLREVYDNLGDERSRLIYLSILKARIIPYELTGDVYGAAVAEGDQYRALPEFRNRDSSTLPKAGQSAAVITLWLGDLIREASCAAK